MVLNYPSMHIAQLIELKVPFKKTRMLLINANFLVLFFFLAKNKQIVKFLSEKKQTNTIKKKCTIYVYKIVGLYD